MRDLTLQVEEGTERVRRLDHDLAVIDVDKQASDAALTDIRLCLTKFDELKPEEQAAVLQTFIAEIRMARSVDEIAVTFDLGELVAKHAGSVKNETPSENSDGVSHAVRIGDPEET